MSWACSRTLAWTPPVASATKRPTGRVPRTQGLAASPLLAFPRSSHPSCRRKWRTSRREASGLDTSVRAGGSSLWRERHCYSLPLTSLNAGG
eukprot:15450884-Alexandrium_andersonii.AAC.1